MITKYTFNPPIQKQVGDTFARNGPWWEQWRAGVLVQRWDLTKQPSEALTGSDSFGSSIDHVYLETHMPGQNVSMTNVRENATTGAIIVDYSSGNQQEYADWAAVGAEADALDTQSALAEKLLLGKAYRASPDGSNKTTQIGASVSVNLNASVPVVYTEPE